MTSSKMDTTQASNESNHTARSYSNISPAHSVEANETRPEPCLDAQPTSPCHNPYLGLPVIATGMTGFVHQIGKDRAVKTARNFDPNYHENRGDIEYLNKINQEILENEIQIFERLGNYKGIIPCFRTSQYGIELALAQGDLESYIENNPEPEDNFKLNWISSLVETFSYIHSRKVFVDDIALRNILILDEQLKIADFGQSIILPLYVDINSAKENDMTVQIEILHLGWILYSISSWQVHKYYFFNPKNLDLLWPKADTFPNIDDILCGKIIEKCWRGEYASMDDVRDEVHQILALLNHEVCSTV